MNDSSLVTVAIERLVPEVLVARTATLNGWPDVFRRWESGSIGMGSTRGDQIRALCLAFKESLKRELAVSQ